MSEGVNGKHSNQPITIYYKKMLVQTKYVAHQTWHLSWDTFCYQQFLKGPFCRYFLSLSIEQVVVIVTRASAASLFTGQEYVIYEPLLERDESDWAAAYCALRPGHKLLN